MSSTPSAPELRKKKSVALSGTVAGDTAICTVGQAGNDLYYRGYDIAELAARATFEEVAHLLIHGGLPTPIQLTAYHDKLRQQRGLPAPVKSVLERIPGGAHPMDVLRTGCSMLGTCEPEQAEHSVPAARDLADRLLACFPSMLLYWQPLRPQRPADRGRDGGPLARRPLPAPAARPGPHAAARTGARPVADCLRRTRVQCVDVYPRASSPGTASDMYSAITGASGALRGPKHGGANEVSLEIQHRYATPAEAEADIRQRLARKEIIIGFGHPVYTGRRPAQPDRQTDRPPVVRGKRPPQPVPHLRADRDGVVGAETHVPKSRLGTPRRCITC